MTDKTRLQENYLSGLEKALPAALKEIDEIMDVYVTHHILTKDVPAIIVEVRAQAAEIAKKDAEIERLQNALDRIIDVPNTEPYISRRYYTIINIARAAREKREVANE
jgi:predicted ArsR family transcriptional regulator